MVENFPLLLLLMMLIGSISASYLNHLENLPDEIQLKIYNQLNPSDFHSLSLVNRQFSSITESKKRHLLAMNQIENLYWFGIQGHQQLIQSLYRDVSFDWMNEKEAEILFSTAVDLKDFEMTQRLFDFYSDDVEKKKSLFKKILKAENLVQYPKTKNQFLIKDYLTQKEKLKSIFNYNWHIEQLSDSDVISILTTIDGDFPLEAFEKALIIEAHLRLRFQIDQCLNILQSTALEEQRRILELIPSALWTTDRLPFELESKFKEIKEIKEFINWIRHMNLTPPRNIMTLQKEFLQRLSQLMTKKTLKLKPFEEAEILCFAVHFNDLQLFRQLIETYQLRPQESTQDGLTPLHQASRFGYEKFIQELLFEHDLILNGIALHEQWTPLHMAVANNHFQIVYTLVENGAALLVTDALGRNPLELARQKNHYYIFRYLKSKQSLVFNHPHRVLDHWLRSLEIDRSKSLNDVIKSGHLSALQKHSFRPCSYSDCKKSWPLNEQSYNAIHLAIEFGHFHLLPFLYEQGVPLNHQLTNGQTPLDLLFKHMKSILSKTKANILYWAHWLLNRGAVLNTFSFQLNVPSFWNSKSRHLFQHFIDTGGILYSSKYTWLDFRFIYNGFLDVDDSFVEYYLKRNPEALVLTDFGSKELHDSRTKELIALHSERYD